ncbi:MAG: glycosyl hydrolase family 32 [Bryobacteraceae bacterium]|jgi:hypothetical protein
MNQTRRDFLETIAVGSGALALHAGTPSDATTPIPIDVGRQLFVDDVLVAETTLKRTFHKPRVHPASPVLKPETSVEMNNGVMPCAGPFSDGVWYDPQDRLYKIWYQAGYDDGFAYAVSVDGIRWQRPELDVVPGTNRVLAPVPKYMRNGSTIWLDHNATDPNERYKMFAYFRLGTGQWPRKLPPDPPPIRQYGEIFTSPDGIHWISRARTGPCGDNSGLFYNPFRKTWTYSIRTSRKPYGRVRSYHEHPDFIASAAWKSEDVEFWLHADEKDLPDPALGYKPELYKVDCVAYESRMLGLFAIYYGPPNPIAFEQKTPKTNDLMLGFSRDGIEWERPDRTAFLACSRQPGTWNRGYLHSAGGLCLVVGDEIRFYYTGFSGISPAQGGGMYAGASTGLATIRRDGFVSRDADRTPGTLTTHPVTFKGKYLFTNADVESGELRVEVLDERGRVIEPFSRKNCIPIRADRTKHAVTWKKATDLAALSGRPVKFRFHLTNGELYSFWVSTDRSGASYGYVAAGGPGFTGATDTTGA